MTVKERHQLSEGKEKLDATGRLEHVSFNKHMQGLDGCHEDRSEVQSLDL